MFYHLKPEMANMRISFALALCALSATAIQVENAQLAPRDYPAPPPPPPPCSTTATPTPTPTPTPPPCGDDGDYSIVTTSTGPVTSSAPPVYTSTTSISTSTSASAKPTTTTGPYNLKSDARTFGASLSFALAILFSVLLLE